MVLRRKKVTSIKTKLKPLVKLVATASHADGSPGVLIIFKFRDRYENIKIISLPISIVMNIGQLKTELVNRNFLPLGNNDDYKEIQNTLLKKTQHTQTIVRVPGIYNSQYLLCNNQVIGKSEGNQVILDESGDLNKPKVLEKGTLDEWKNELAIFALNSSRLMLALSSVFSSYVIKFTDIENGGFHNFGKSSTGKTTILVFASTALGPVDNMETWRNTEAALEEISAARNDSILILDELKLLDGNSKIAAEKASDIAYKITSGQGKRRSKKYENFTLKWRLVCLSAGEDSLAENAKKGQAQRYLGEEVRIPDVPADAGKKMGIFESLPEGISTPSEFSEIINSHSKYYYGTAQIAFLEKLTKHLAKDETIITGKLQQFIRDFLDKHNIDGKTGHVARLAKRFALAYAGGVLAVRFKVLPFTEEDVMQGISRCYQNTLKIRPMTLDEKVLLAHKRVLKNLKSRGMLDISYKEHGYTCDELKKGKVFKTIINDKKVRIISSSYLKSLVPDSEVFDTLIEQFKYEKRLYGDANKRTTRQFASNIPECTLPRGYVFLPKKVS